MKRLWLVVLLLGSVITVGLGLGSVYLIDYYANQAPAAHLATMGTIGDMFGLVGALFAGLGFVGLAAALVFDAQKRAEDLEDRRRARLPFVVPSIDDQGAAIDRLDRPRGRLEVDLRITVKLDNLTPEPALDLDLSGTVLSGGDGAQVESEVSGTAWPRKGTRRVRNPPLQRRGSSCDRSTASDSAGSDRGPHDGDIQQPEWCRVEVRGRLQVVLQTQMTSTPTHPSVIRRANTPSRPRALAQNKWAPSRVLSG